MAMALKQERLDVTATKVVKNEDYLNIPIAKVMGIMERGKFDSIMDKVKPNLSMKDTIYGGRLEVVFEGRKDGKWHLLGIEISKQELDPQTGDVLLPIKHPYTEPDYLVKFRVLEEPLRSELVGEISKRMRIEVVKD